MTGWIARRDLVRLGAGFGGVAAVTLAYGRWIEVNNGTIVALTFLLVVLVVAATSKLWIAVTTSLASMACFNFFFLPPVGTLTITDPENWVALFALLAVSLVASNLSSAVRARAQEALDRRDEMARLFDLSRDVLLMTDTREAIALLARFVSRRFDLDYVAICLPRAGSWEVSEAEGASLALDRSQLSLAMAGAAQAPEFDARARTYGGHRTMAVGGRVVRLVPLRLGTKPVGLLAASGRPVEPGALDAVAGVVAIAIERVQLLEERKAAELAKQSEALKSTLLASIGHDLRTPLTAIRVAATNLQASWLTEADRREQSEVALAEVERLTRLFQNILEMARIDAGALAAERVWVYPSEILEAARDQVEHTLQAHRLEVSVESDAIVRVDPRLTASALAHVLENAAQYTSEGSSITVTLAVSDEGLVVEVRDRGPGIAPQDLAHLFDRFYRGSEAKQRVSGTGMGLSIARGLLAAEQGRVSAENCADVGARFTIVVPAETRLAALSESAS